MSDPSITPTQPGALEHAEHYDPMAAKIGMWLFLFTEFLLFGSLFIAFAVYLYLYRYDFQMGSEQLERLVGATNTVILLTSSLTMALSIAALERGRRRLCQGLLVVTLLFAACFLVIKSMEWGAKISHDIYPASATMLQKTVGEQVFFGLYFAMTGLHGLHVIIGVVVILYAMLLIKGNRVNAERGVFLHNTGLYWHLVDLIWIFLFPLYYLIG